MPRAALFVTISILRGEFVAVVTVGFPSIDRVPAHAAQHVLSNRDWLHMLRIHAQSVAAEMIDLKPHWNRANQPFIGESMRECL